MSYKALTTYLNDHLAGSVAALELLEHLITLHHSTDRQKFFTTIRAEVEEDQKTLQGFLREVGGKESWERKAAAWLSEKLGEAKLQLDDPQGGELRLFEAVETLALGIQGKLALWRALAAAADRAPQTRHLDLANLERRARDQFEQVEGLRLRLAPVALSS